DRLAGELGLVEVAEHDGGTAHPHLADAAGVDVAQLELGAVDRPTDAVAAEGLEVVDGEHGASLGEAVADDDGQAEAVEVLGAGAVDEGAAAEHEPQATAEVVVDRAE